MVFIRDNLLVLDKIVKSDMMCGVTDDYRSLQNCSISHAHTGNFTGISSYNFRDLLIHFDIYAPLCGEFREVLADRAHSSADIVPHILAVDLTHHVMHQYVAATL